MDYPESGISLAALNTADIADIQAAGVSKLLLGKFPLNPDLAYYVSELAGNTFRWPHGQRVGAGAELS